MNPIWVTKALNRPQNGPNMVLNITSVCCTSTGLSLVEMAKYITYPVRNKLWTQRAGGDIKEASLPFLSYVFVSVRKLIVVRTLEPLESMTF